MPRVYSKKKLLAEYLGYCPRAGVSVGAPLSLYSATTPASYPGPWSDARWVEMLGSSSAYLTCLRWRWMVDGVCVRLDMVAPMRSPLPSRAPSCPTLILKFGPAAMVGPGLCGRASVGVSPLRVGWPPPCTAGGGVRSRRCYTALTNLIPLIGGRVVLVLSRVM